ncbi:MAG: hypothetical protein LLG04_04850 [Parachlamydia sp.]|nr:hypothetical protein [Parachlamydia sp.]
MNGDFSNSFDFKFSNIEKGKSERTGEKWIKVSGTLQGHEVTLILTLEPKTNRDDVIKKIKSQGLSITRHLEGNTQFIASTGDPRKPISLVVQVNSSEKSFNASQIIGSNLRMTQETSKKVAERHFGSRKGGYAALEGSPPTNPTFQASAIQNKAAVELPISQQLRPPPTRPPPRSAASMEEEIMKSAYFQADMHPMRAAEALMDPRIVPGTVIVSKSYTYPKSYPFVATVKLQDGTVSQNLISIEKAAHATVYRIRDGDSQEVKVGAGAGYAQIVECLDALSKSELARVPPKPTTKPHPALTAAQQEMVQFKAGLHERARQLIQELQGFKDPLQEMGCKAHEVDFTLISFCYTIAAFERSGQSELRIRKNVPIYPQLGVSLPFTCFLTRKAGGQKTGEQGVLVHMTTPGVVQGAVIGQGTYKVVKTNYDIDLPTAGSTQRALIKAQELVLVRAKKGTEAEVIKGINLMKKLRQEIGPDVIPAIFSERSYMSKTGKVRYEFNQIRFNGDFDKVIREGQLPLRTASAISQGGPAGMKKFQLADKLNALIDVSGKIVRFHAAGYVHRDVKPPNMLIEFVQAPLSEPTQAPKQEPRAVAIPADYDLTRKSGFEAPTAPGKVYAFWDPCAREGIITPNCDVYGLAYSLGMAIFPNYYDTIKSRTQLDPNKDFATLMYAKTYNKLQEIGMLNTPAANEFLTKLAASPPAFPSYCKEVDQFLNQMCLSGSLSSGQVQEIRKFQAELPAIPNLWGLILRVVNTSDELLRDVQARSDLMQKLQSGNPQLAQEAANEVTSMAAWKGIPTAQLFSAFLQLQLANMASASLWFKLV